MIEFSILGNRRATFFFFYRVRGTQKVSEHFSFYRVLIQCKTYFHLSFLVCCEEAVDIVDNYSTNQNESGQIKGMITPRGGQGKIKSTIENKRVASTYFSKSDL